MKKWDKDMPVFYDTYHGETVEGVNLLKWFGIEVRSFMEEKRNPRASWPWCLNKNDLTPLTPTAQAMMDLVWEDD